VAPHFWCLDSKRTVLSPLGTPSLPPSERVTFNKLFNQSFRKASNRSPPCLCAMHPQQSQTWIKSREVPNCIPRSSSSSTSLDDEDPDRRLKPFWPKYQHLFHNRGLHLDTISDVGEHTVQYPLQSQQYWRSASDGSLCHDPSLVSSDTDPNTEPMSPTPLGSLIVYSGAREIWIENDLSQRLFMSIVRSMK
jgi:hypothetical protein